jgi:uncharacterized protein
MSSQIVNAVLADIKEAMKARDSEKLTALRTLHAQIKDATVNAGIEPADADVVTVIGKAVKQRRDSVEQFRQGGRQDLADKEQREADLFLKYMPKQLTEPEIEELARQCIAESGAMDRKELGKVMAVLMPQVKGRADGKLVNQVVSRLLPAQSPEPQAPSGGTG